MKDQVLPFRKALSLGAYLVLSPSLLACASAAPTGKPVQEKPQAKTSKETQKPLAEGEVRVSKAMWLEQVTTALPAMLCTDGNYFRTCFDVTLENCVSTGTAATASCVAKIAPEIPNSLILPREGTHWGTMIGRCTGTVLEANITPHRVESDACTTILEEIKSQM